MNIAEKRSDKKKIESNPQAVTIAFHLPKSLPTQFLCCGVVFLKYSFGHSTWLFA